MNVDNTPTAPHRETYESLQQAWRDRPTEGPVRIGIVVGTASVIAGFVTSFTPYQWPILGAYLVVLYAFLAYRCTYRAAQANFRRHVTRPYCRTFYVLAWRVRRRGSWRCDCRRWHPTPNYIDTEGLQRWAKPRVAR